MRNDYSNFAKVGGNRVDLTGLVGYFDDLSGWTWGEVFGLLSTMSGKTRVSFAGMIFGGLMMTGPLVAVLGTMFGMTRAFSVLGNQGIGDPKGLANGMSVVLISAAVGTGLFVLGAVVLVVSAVVYSRAIRAAKSGEGPGGPVLVTGTGGV